MIEDKIVVRDTNIFLDLLSISLINDFFSLPCKICTTDFVINEIIKPDEFKKISMLIKTKKLEVVSFEFDELAKINSIQDASFTDCSVWYYAKKTNSRLLTGDGKLRKVAEKDNVKVSGILYIFDNLIEYKIMEKGRVI